MAETVRLSVVVPVKDEAGNVVPLAREIAAAAGESPYEMVFVDDGSSDGTIAELLALKGELPVRVLAHGRNLGQSRAIRTGVRAARAEIVVTLDGDGQNDPADIPKVVALLGDENVAMAAGERARRQDNWRKRMASRLGNGLRRFLLDDKARDTGCGLKAFRRDAFLALPYFDHMHRYLIALMLREGYEVRFVDVGHRPRGRGRSKYGVWDRLVVGISDLMGVMWLKRRFRGPDAEGILTMEAAAHWITVDHVWLLVGFLGQGLFASRFIIQWFKSELVGRSVIPLAFWYCSLGGGIVLLAYAIYKRDPVFITGQASGLFVYARNLYLIRRETHPALEIKTPS